MKRAELEHIIRAAAGLTNEREFVVVGAAALLGSVPAPRSDLTQTLEADIYPRRRPELSELIDGTMGELSLFHDTYRYYAHGVGPDTAILPEGWEARLVAIQGPATNGAIGYCLEPHDLAASKLVAGREKDQAFVQAMIRDRLLSEEQLRERIALLPVPEAQRRHLAQWTRTRSARRG